MDANSVTTIEQVLGLQELETEGFGSDLAAPISSISLIRQFCN